MAAATKGLVLDANILIDAVLGTRVRFLLEAFAKKTIFYSPEVCLADAHRNVPEICSKHRLDLPKTLEFLTWIDRFVETIPESVYGAHEQEARERIQSRDSDDWPVVATALVLDLPIWTEDRDFFGCGVASWITNTVEIYLREDAATPPRSS